MTSMVERALGAHWVLEAAAADGLPEPRLVSLYTHNDPDAVTISVAQAADVFRWAQWLGRPRDVEASWSNGQMTTVLHSEKYDQPLRIWHIDAAPDQEGA